MDLHDEQVAKIKEMSNSLTGLSKWVKRQSKKTKEPEVINYISSKLDEQIRMMRDFIVLYSWK